MIKNIFTNLALSGLVCFGLYAILLTTLTACKNDKGEFVLPELKVEVTSVTPRDAVLGVETSFVITGNKLYNGLEYKLTNLLSITFVSVNSAGTSAIFKGMPSGLAGSKTGKIKDKSNGKEIFSYAVTYVNPIITVSSVTPQQATLGQEISFTVIGKNLTSALVYELTDLSNTSFVRVNSTKTSFVFKGTPSGSAGMKLGKIKNKGTDLFSFSVEFLSAPNNAPSVPTLQTPINGLNDAEVTVNLSWLSSTDSDGDAVTYDVYLGSVSSPNNTVATNLSVPSFSVDNLSYDTQYYWKIVAKDSKGATSESTVRSFKTKVTPKCPVLVYDGKTYSTVQIGTQCWMAENLNTTNHGTGTGSSTCYDNLASHCATYGRLYNWEVASHIASDIPGWSLPSTAQLQTLTTELGGELVAGGKMKVGGSIGFNALFGGAMYVGGSFSGMGTSGIYWTSTIPAFLNPSGTGAWVYFVLSVSANLHRDYRARTDFYSVRLIKDN